MHMMSENDLIELEIYFMKTYYCVPYIPIYMIFCAHPFCFICVLSNGIRLRQHWNMEPLPHYINLYLRFHDPKPWQWKHH